MGYVQLKVWVLAVLISLLAANVLCQTISFDVISDLVEGRNLALRCSVSGIKNHSISIEIRQGSQRIASAENNCNQPNVTTKIDQIKCSSDSRGINLTVGINAASRVRDSGLWVCEHSDSNSDVQVSRNDFKVPVKQVSLLKTSRVVAGETYAFSCKVNPSKPRPEVRWFLQNNDGELQIVTGDRASDVNKEDLFEVTSVLTLTMNKVHNGNRLKCSASNGWGYVNVSLILDVQYSPKIRIDVASNPVLSGNQLMLRCIVEDANPSVSSFTWLHNGSVRSSGQVFTRRTNMMDGGRYTCLAKNSNSIPAGNTSVTIGVLEVPSRAINIFCTEQTSESLKLEWTSNNVQENTTTEVALQQRESEETEWADVVGNIERESTEKRTVTIVGLFEDSLYFFRVRYFNKLAESNFSVTSCFTAEAGSLEAGVGIGIGVCFLVAAIVLLVLFLYCYSQGRAVFWKTSDKQRKNGNLQLAVNFSPSGVTNEYFSPAATGVPQTSNVYDSLQNSGASPQKTYEGLKFYENFQGQNSGQIYVNADMVSKSPNVRTNPLNE